MRFGAAGDVAIEILDLYSWTDGFGLPSEIDPEHGRLIGVAIHFRATVTNQGGEWAQEVLATIELGNRYMHGMYTHVDADPQGLIHDEEIYHEPTSLLAAAEANL